MKKNFFYSTLLFAIPILGTVTLNTEVTAEDNSVIHENIMTQILEKRNNENQSIDIATGWEIVEWSSDYEGMDPYKILQQGHETPELNQRMMAMQFGNIGEATMTIQKKISMKKGYTYNFNLIYAMFFNSTGSGYIDFNGDRRISGSSPTDQNFEETIIPSEDMEYTISAGFSVPRLGNGFMKVAYNIDGSGVTVTANVPELQINNPEGNHNEVIGTGIPGNSVEIYDDSQMLLGETFVDENGNFKVITNRVLKTGEEIVGYQVDLDGQRSFGTKVTVDEPVLNAYSVEANLGLVEGTVNQPAIIEVFDEDGILLGSDSLESAGDYSIALNRKLVFMEKLTIRATLEDETTRNLNMVVQDTIAPNIPRLDPIDNQKVLITGQSDESDLAIYIQQGDILYRTYTQNEGNFEIVVDHPFEANSEVVCWAEDLAGNRSDLLTVVVAPVAAIIELEDDVTSISNQITGRTNIPNTVVTVNVGSRIYKVTADGNGEFKVMLATTYAVGTNVTASIYDEATNQEVMTSVKVRPKTPTVSFLSTSSRVVNGMTEANSEVTLTVIRDSEIYTIDSVISDDFGSFEMPLTLDGNEFKLNFGDTVRIQAKHIPTGLNSLVHEEFIFIK